MVQGCIRTLYINSFMRFLDIHSCINIKVAVQLQVTRRANNWTVYYRSKRAKPPSVSMAIYSISYNFTYLLKNSDLTALKEWHDLVSEQSTVRSTRAQSPENSGENSDAILTPSHSQIWRWGNTGSTTPGVGPAILLMSWILKTFLLSIEWLSKGMGRKTKSVWRVYWQTSNLTKLLMRSGKRKLLQHTQFKESALNHRDRYDLPQNSSDAVEV